MQVLILVCCVIAAASATWAPWAQHIPVIGPHGVPIDTPEVQHAKAAHAAAHIFARTGLALVSAYSGLHAYGVPAIAHNGLPLDTPEVAQAKLQHYHDYAVAAQKNGVHVAPVVALGAHPIDTPEVQLAKSAHFAAHAEALARNGVHYRKRRSIYGYAQHIPVIGPNGVPIDTPEVQHARAAHLAALNEASARAGVVGPVVPSYWGSQWSHTYPALAADGQPIETPEVQALKAQHFAAHSEAAARNGAWSPWAYAAPWAHGHVSLVPGLNVPVDTPEVQHARAAHLAAHAAAHH